MATTPGGLPYPVGTDHVVDGDDAIKALALGVENKKRPSGRLRMTVLTGGYAQSTWNTVPFDSEAWLFGGISGALHRVGSTYVIDKAGLFLASATISGSASAYLARVIASGQLIAAGAAGAAQEFTVTGIMWLAAGQAVSAQVFPTTAGFQTPADTPARPVCLDVEALDYV
jgi:hypothetical protein